MTLFYECCCGYSQMKDFEDNADALQKLSAMLRKHAHVTCDCKPPTTKPRMTILIWRTAT